MKGWKIIGILAAFGLFLVGVIYLTDVSRGTYPQTVNIVDNQDPGMLLMKFNNDAVITANQLFDVRLTQTDTYLVRSQRWIRNNNETAAVRQNLTYRYRVGVTTLFV